MKMKIMTVSLFVMVALAVSLSFSLTTPAAPQTSAAAVLSASLEPNAAPAPPAEPHPEIREALAALRRAKGHMEHAAHDFGGHRMEALKATDEAIRQLEICLKYDKD
jgi:hypothetical protein